MTLTALAMTLTALAMTLTALAMTLTQLRRFVPGARRNPLKSLHRGHKGLHYIGVCAALILGGG
jgi:hypothetical protein